MPGHSIDSIRKACWSLDKSNQTLLPNIKDYEKTEFEEINELRGSSLINGEYQPILNYKSNSFI